MTELNGPDIVACCQLSAGSHRSSPVNSPTEETITENVTNKETETTHSQGPAENSNNVIINYIIIIYIH